MPRTLILLTLLLHLPSAWCARVAPSPMVRQLAEGYGFVAAEIFQYVAQPEHGGIQKYRVTFKIKETYVQPLEGREFKFRQGKVLMLWITVGYGGMCEHDDLESQPFKRGTKYLLPIKYNKDLAVYEHAPGAGGFAPVSTFSATMKQRVKAVHQLAAQPREKRLTSCHRILMQPSEDVFIRRQALIEMAALKDPASVQVLKELWETRIGEQSGVFAMDLDYYARQMIGEDFERSPARRDYWVSRYLESMEGLSPEERLQEAMARNNLLSGLLVEIGRYHPKEVTVRLLPVFREPKWPEAYRVTTLRILLNLHRILDELPLQWEPALQQVAREMQGRVAGQEEVFLEQVLHWAASPPSQWEKRSFTLVPEE
ncbi:MAG: hypothetical protein ACI9TH_003183 [Kiritimatiellia bacterium]|jgi:hypothetical protein